MKRRLDLAMTLVGDPRIVFLDEPTTGLDPRGRRTMWDIVRGLVADGITIFLTTQYLEEADELAGRIALLDEGHIVARGHAGRAEAACPGRPHPARVRRSGSARACCRTPRDGAPRSGCPRPRRSRPMARSPPCGRCSIGRRQRRSKSPGYPPHTRSRRRLPDPHRRATPNERWPPNDRSLVRAPGHGDNAPPEPASRSPISLAHAAGRGDPGRSST